LGQHIAVPAFFTIPSKFNGRDNWADLVAAGSAVSFVVPDHSLISYDADDPSVANAAKQLKACRDAGQQVLGYVSTGYAKRPVSKIEADIYRWYDYYGLYLSGIFFDEGPTFDPSHSPLSESTQQAFYTTLIFNFQKQHSGQNTVLLNATQFSSEWVMNDPLVNKPNVHVIVWEQTIDKYNDDSKFVAELPGGNVVGQGDPNFPNWWTNGKYTDRIVHVVHDCIQPNKTTTCYSSAPEQDMLLAVQKSKARKAGHVYVYDGNPGCGGMQTCPDPKDPSGHPQGGYWRLPAFWRQEWQAVECLALREDSLLKYVYCLVKTRLIFPLRKLLKLGTLRR